jgi:hypothetical protein
MNEPKDVTFKISTLSLNQQLQFHHGNCANFLVYPYNLRQVISVKHKKKLFVCLLQIDNPLFIHFNLE